MKRRALALIGAGALVVAGCGDGDGLEIRDARIGQPTGPNAALYFSASGGADRLLGAETDLAKAVEIHETVISDDGTMSMHSRDALQLEGGSDLVLAPGGLHLMLLDVERLEVGDMVKVTLIWENAGEVTLDAEVVSPADTLSHGS